MIRIQPFHIRSPSMPNLIKELKSEITRLAKKEVKASVSPLQKKTIALTRALAAKKRQVSDLEKRVARLEKLLKESRPATPKVSPEELKIARVGPTLLKSQRKRLKINQEQMAKLMNVNVASLRNWEQGKSRPRKEAVAALVGIRKMEIPVAYGILGLEVPEKKDRRRRKKRGRK